MDKISIVVPCYNEEGSLPLFYEKCTKELCKLEDVSYEFIFIDDGSSDNTLDVLKLLAYCDTNCRYYSFSRNFGKEAAMYAGLQYASGDYCVIMDADLQHPPELLGSMYQAVRNEGYDCCAGMRADRQGEGKVRNTLSHLFYKLIQKLTHMNMSDGAGDFRMMSRTMVNAILEMKEYNRYMKGVFSFVGFQTKWLPFHNVQRISGESKWNFKSLFSYALDGILSFSTTPLTFAGMIGALLLLLSLLFGGFTFIQAIFFNRQISLLMIVIEIILFLSSLQMIFLYILGQYLSKDYMENKKRPIYIVKESNHALPL